MQEISILYLEDSDMDLELVQSYLDEQIPYRMKHVKKRENFESALNKTVFDLILLDYSLPGFDGLSALKMVKDIQPNTPVILISGTIGEEIAIETLKQGATDYVLKQRMPRLIPSIRRARHEFEEHQERLKAEQALRASEERYRSLFNDAIDMIHIIDTSGRIMDVNPSELNTLGYEKDEYIGKHLLDIIHPDYRQSSQKYLDEVLQGNNVQGYETALVSKAGKCIYVEVNAVPEFNDGSVITARAFLHNITDRKAAEDAIRHSLKEKDILLKEIHHRVKNNLQIIVSLLNLQFRYIEDKDALKAFDESRNRVYSMALVHEKLYQSPDFSKIDFKGYVESMSKELFSTYLIGNHIQLKLNIGDLGLDIEQAIPCGLIINELLSNALKYGFPDKTGGMVHIEFKRLDSEMVCLSVSDNGVGMDPDYDFANSQTLGHVLVKVLANQLNGEVRMLTDRGVRVEIKFPFVNAEH